ncbi:MAG TPA: acyl carrier protein, partial [Chryseosolibacter sp.]
MTKQEILNTLKEEIARETGIPVTQVDEDASFYSLGLDSISAVFVLDEVERKLKIEMNPMFFWDYPTVRLLADHLSSLNHH